MPGDDTATTTTTTTTKTTPPETVQPAGKRTRKPMSYLLLAERLDGDGKCIGYDIVQTPPGVRKVKPIRRDFERGVLTELEAGNNVKLYNNRALCVAQLGETFKFAAKVKEETIRKVTVTKV